MRDARLTRTLESSGSAHCGGQWQRALWSSSSSTSCTVARVQAAP
jgi:hypothetical protein